MVSNNSTNTPYGIRTEVIANGKRIASRKRWAGYLADAAGLFIILFSITTLLFI